MQKNKLFVFVNGNFQEMEEDHPLGDLHDDLDIWAFMKEQAFDGSQTVGNDEGLSYRLYESMERRQWLVQFQTASNFCWIRCDNWPTLIQLLSLLSPIALAGLSVSHDFGAYLPVRTQSD